MNVRDKLKVGPVSDRYEMPTAGTLDEPPIRPIYTRPALRPDDRPQSTWQMIASRLSDFVHERDRVIALWLIALVAAFILLGVVILVGERAAVGTMS